MVELRRRIINNGQSLKRPAKVKSNESSDNEPSPADTVSPPSFTNSVLTGLKVIFFLCVIPPMLNYAGLQKEKDFLRSQATLFDIGFGQKMFMNCSGSGRPTVILDAPTGLTSDAWVAGQRHLAETTRVCVYDRAGLGLSDPPPWLNASDPGEAAVSRTLGTYAPLHFYH